MTNNHPLLLLVVIGAVTAFSSGLALAEALPPEALQQQYQACLDKIANNGDGIALTAKQNYCACVRDGLAAKWDTDKVSAMAAADQQQGKLPESDLAAVEDIGRSCVAQALR